MSKLLCHVKVATGLSHFGYIFRNDRFDLGAIWQAVLKKVKNLQRVIMQEWV